MEALLLAGYRPKEALGLETDEVGKLLLDHHIDQLKSLGLDPVVVLAGDPADEVLRKSSSLQGCELVFDANYHEANLFTNLRSGLKVTEKACFVLPVEIPVAPENVWRQLKAELLTQGLLTSYHAFQLTTEEGAPWHYGFPLLISTIGNKIIQNLKQPTGLTDARIRYHFSRPPLALSSPSL